MTNWKFPSQHPVTNVQIPPEAQVFGGLLLVDPTKRPAVLFGTRLVPGVGLTYTYRWLFYLETRPIDPGGRQI